MKLIKILIPCIALSTVLSSVSVFAETWGNTEIHIQHGELERVGTGGTADSTILTFQHAGGWEYGDNFFFIDHSRHSVKNNANFPVDDSSEFYGEWYSTFSLSAISGKDFSFGVVKDIGIVAGFNFAPEVDSNWFLPGVRFSLDLPGFAFAQIALTSYIHQGGGSADSSAFTVVDEETSYMVDFSWDYPFKLGDASWNITGHLEYIDGRERTSSFGTSELSSWILFQPQVRLDAGELLGAKAGRLFVGIEYQYWKNKLGEKGTDDNAVQLLGVWRF